MKLLFLIVFFFSSRRRHTRSLRDWSSDVCSSDLVQLQMTDGDGGTSVAVTKTITVTAVNDAPTIAIGGNIGYQQNARSEERRVGKECRLRRSPYEKKKKK